MALSKDANRPTMAPVMSQPVPPPLIKGSAIPVVGMSPVTTIIFMRPCVVSMRIMPRASRRPKTSSHRLPMPMPVHNRMSNMSMTMAAPNRPISSQMGAKIKSVVSSGV